MLPLLQYALKESWALRKGNTVDIGGVLSDAFPVAAGRRLRVEFLPAVLRGHEGSVRSATFSPDGSRIVGGRPYGTFMAAQDRDLLPARGIPDAGGEPRRRQYTIRRRVSQSQGKVGA